jgi:sigma-B regulation protein RsbU (phosphoserine phosphatase)
MPDTVSLPVPTSPDPVAIRATLINRRDRLAALPQAATATRVASLLSEIDAALDRLEGGHYGACSRCDGEVEVDRLAADPLATVCLDCLNEGERRALERDLETASRVQAALLPARDFASAAWRGHYAYIPYGAVSGDYVDVVPSANELLVMVGDVAGKGVAAALLMSQLHAMFRATAAPGLGLGEMMQRVNRLLGAATTANAYATLAAARLRTDGSVELCNAGHASPLLLTAQGVEPLPADGLPLGLFADAKYSTRDIPVGVGEGLLLYTDGLSEGHGPDGCELGVDGLRSLLGGSPKDAPAGLVELCLGAAASHRGGVPAHDDLTVMALLRAR